MSDQPTAGKQPEVWTSRFAFLYACAGAAIGLGSLWRFPYVAGTSGGGAFVLLFLLIIVVLCVPLMMAEMLIGRRGGGSCMLSVANMIRGEKAMGAWKAIGWLSILIPFLGLSYYSVLAGWALDYARVAIVEGFSGIAGHGAHLTPDAIGAASGVKFKELSEDPMRQGLLQGVFIAFVALVVALGVQRGIEWVSRIKMAGLVIILVGLVVYSGLNLDLHKAVQFLFVPDFSKLTGPVILAALGQALFSTSIGVGVIMTYSAYLPARMSLAQASLTINGSVAVAATLAGLAIFPAVFTYGLKPGAGPSLVFITLPAAFAQMPNGRIVGAFFFVMLTLAAFTVAVGMLEPVVAWLREKTGGKRGIVAWLTGAAAFAVGLPSLLSSSVLKDWHPLSMVPKFADKTFLDLLDFSIANVLLPLNALLIALFVGWAVSRATVKDELNLTGLRDGFFRFVIRYLAPVIIIGLMINLIAFSGS